MLRVDLHLHTRFSGDSRTTPAQLVARCKATGLNCIAVTDHNTVRGALAVRDVAPFTVIIGEEVRTTEGEVTGLFLRSEVPRGLPPGEAARLIRAQGGLVSVPHPFDRFRRGSALSARGLAEVLPLAHIVEAFNARNLRAQDDDRALRLAREHGLLVSAVSDAHTAGEVGRTYVEMPEFDGTPEGFLAALARGRLVTHRASPLVHLASTWNKVLKLVERR